jgi:TetR/AcrR family transcriptional regulator
MAASTSPKVRDADRSRAAILDAAERLFAQHGLDGTSLGDIGAAARLSRGTPGYFFGSKEGLYVAVLERIFSERQAATEEAFGALTAWVSEGSGSLEPALKRAVEGYLAFLLDRPAFVRLLQREDLSGGRHLKTANRDSRAMTEAFTALRKVARARGLRAFRVDDAVMLFVSLTFSPLTQRATFLAALDRDLESPAVRRRHVAFVVDQLLYLATGTGGPPRFAPDHLPPRR